jgi:uncharacterized repeat protein (TIGR02543 family)
LECNFPGPENKSVIVRFETSGGILLQKINIKKNTVIIKPENPEKKEYKFFGWYNDEQGIDRWNFDTDIVTGNITLYAKWSKSFSEPDHLRSYLNSADKNTKDTPIAISMDNYDLGDTMHSSSGWKNLLKAINAAGIYMDLDLSACTMIGTEFKLNSNIPVGKSKITSLIFPDAATSIKSGSGWSDPAFRYFTSLKFAGGANITDIGSFTFCHCVSLLQIDFPKAQTIGLDAFSGCIYLESVSFPNVILIGESAFYGCTNLGIARFPKITNIEKYAFGSTGSHALTFHLGNISPEIKEHLFLSVSSEKNVTVIIPLVAYNYGSNPENNTDCNWANAFRGMGWNESGYLSGPVNSNICLKIESLEN